MNEFQFNSTPQEQAMSDMLKSQSHRLARQQIIFALIFLLVIVLAAYYIVTRMIWAIYDGYITIDENPISAVDDIYILKVNKEIGEVVHKGDTLYSYVLLGNIVNQYDPNILPSAVKETHDMEVQAQLAKEEIPVLRTRLAELKSRRLQRVRISITDSPTTPSAMPWMQRLPKWKKNSGSRQTRWKSTPGQRTPPTTSWLEEVLPPTMRICPTPATRASTARD